jgi:hypothetical protein
MARKYNVKDEIWDFVFKKGKVRDKDFVQEFIKSDENPCGKVARGTFYKHRKELLDEGKIEIRPEKAASRFVSYYYVPEVFRWELMTKKLLYTIGDCKLEFIRWYGTGESNNEFTMRDVICQYEDRSVPLPEELRSVKEEILKDKLEEAREKGQVFDDNPHYKLLKIQLGREFVEETRDRKQRVYLTYGPTDFFSCLATNLSLDKRLSQDDQGHPVTIRDRCLKVNNLGDPTYLQSSPLANSFGIALAALTQDDKILLQKRSNQVALGSGKLTVATAEMMLRDRDMDKNGKPSPFITAQRCVKAELGVEITPEDVMFLLFGVRLDYGLPQALGVLRLGMRSNELPTSYKAIDKWEGFNFPEEFSASALKKYLLEPHASLISDTAKLTIVLALVNEYGFEKVERSLHR